LLPRIRELPGYMGAAVLGDRPSGRGAHHIKDVPRGRGPRSGGSGATIITD
jgi:hypothetical protein